MHLGNRRLICAAAVGFALASCGGDDQQSERDAVQEAVTAEFPNETKGFTFKQVDVTKNHARVQAVARLYGNSYFVNLSKRNGKWHVDGAQYRPPKIDESKLAGGPYGSSDEDQVRKVVTTFANAVALGQTKVACAQQTPEHLRETAKDAHQPRLRSDEARCRAVFLATTTALPARSRRLQPHLPVRVTVDGDRAAAYYESLLGKGKLKVDLVKTGGEWKIAAEPRPVARAATKPQ